MKNTKKIIIDDAVPYAKEIFSHLGQIETLPGRDITRQHLIDAQALIVRSRTKVDEALLRDTPIEFVGSTVVGLDHIDQDYLKNQGIHFYSAQGCNANSVAEYIITVLFNLAEHFKFDLTQKTLGIVGVGNVGSRVYEKAKKLGIECLLNDPPKEMSDPIETHKHPYVDLDTCLKADIITVHTPLTSKGKHPTFDLINIQRLKNITPQQIIINAARGGIINEQAWTETTTLANVIDCWENEPFINEALYNKAWIATPHIAGHSLDAKIAGSKMVYKQLCQFWQVSENTTWHSALPEKPKPINMIDNHSWQTQLNQLFNATHNIFNDDANIRGKNIADTHKNYEYYRRNFPVYREWHHHTVMNSLKEKNNNILKLLGFTTIKPK